MMNYAIRLTDVPEDTLRRAAYDRAKTGRNDLRPLILTVEDSARQAVGGLWGRNAYDFLKKTLAGR